MGGSRTPCDYMKYFFSCVSSLIFRFCTVLEYCDGNDLDFLLKQHKTVPEREVRTIVSFLVCKIVFLSMIVWPISDKLGECASIYVTRKASVIVKGKN